jgi:carotenoid cleavage dioxygenase-like enzyme
MAVNFHNDPAVGFGGGPFRAEIDLYDCEVDGEIPSNFNGTFYRVGPDWLYPPRYGNDVVFNGDGHAAMFRIANGHADFKSRYVKTQRHEANYKAREMLFGVYRNRYTDDPRVRSLSGGTANTHIVFHNGRLFALKEDSPPVLVDPHTLETIDNYYTFGDKLTSLTFTAHPKIDNATGEMIFFGYEAKGEATRDIAVYAADKNGNITWEAWVKAPYTCMLHDFAVTETHIAFLVIPYVTSVERMKQGEVHWAWDTQAPTWFGVMRRGGDGSDCRWFKGPERCATHTMGAFSDGDKVYVDMDMGLSGQFPFFPFLHGDHWSPQKAAGFVTRLSVDLSKKTETYDMEVLYPKESGALPRQDDRYVCHPYKIGIMPCSSFGPGGQRSSVVMFDHSTSKTRSYTLPDGSGLQEPVFAPRKADAPEGDGWIVGMVSRGKEGGRSDFIILDTDHLEDGPVATIKLPFRAMSQVHGWWVPDWQLPVT